MEAKVTINKVKHITLQIGRKGGIVVDQDLHIGSTNAVSTGAVVEALNQLDAEVTENLSKLDTEVSENLSKLDAKVAEGLGELDAEVAEVNKKCDDIVIGDHPKMTVGFADNLVGRGDPSAEQFVYQPTANDLSVLDEPARIKQIKGNSIVWNQRIPLTLPSPYNNRVDVGVSAAGYSCTVNSVAYSYVGIYYYAHTADPRFPEFVDGHIYAVSCSYLGSKSSTVQMGMGSSFASFSVPASTPTTLICIYPYGGNSATWQLNSYIDGMKVGDKFDISRVKIYDLTQMFGAGNEPATDDEFLARIPKGVDMNAYNEGELISMKTEAIKTVGFNQWDEQWEIGRINQTTGATEPKDNSIRCKNYIPVIPNTKYYVHRGSSGKEYFIFYDRDYNYIGNKYVGDNFITPANCAYIKFRFNSAYGTVYKRDICINIWHSGYKNGTYEPYETFTRELGVIGKYFPGGMRKAGDVFDSIEWDGDKLIWKAVQRVGERAYASGDETNSAVTTDKVKTLYALTNPIVTEIAEGLNFDYKVWDFGTEEALSSVISAPFSADIIYGFNAVDNIRTLLERVRVLESKHP